MSIVDNDSTLRVRTKLLRKLHRRCNGVSCEGNIGCRSCVGFRVTWSFIYNEPTNLTSAAAEYSTRQLYVVTFELFMAKPNTIYRTELMFVCFHFAFRVSNLCKVRFQRFERFLCKWLTSLSEESLFFKINSPRSVMNANERLERIRCMLAVTRSYSTESQRQNHVSM